VCNDVSFLEAYGADLTQWPHLSSVIEVRRRVWRSNGWSFEVNLFMSTCIWTEVAKIEKIIQEHWFIENKLHYVMDTAFREDAIRIKDRTHAINRAIMRRATLNVYSYCNKKTSKENIGLQCITDSKFLGILCR
jgi:hypothetical protein